MEEVGGRSFYRWACLELSCHTINQSHVLIESMSEGLRRLKVGCTHTGVQRRLGGNGKRRGRGGGLYTIHIFITVEMFQEVLELTGIHNTKTAQQRADWVAVRAPSGRVWGQTATPGTG